MKDNSDKENTIIDVVIVPIFKEPCDNNQYYLEIRGFFTKEEAERLRQKVMMMR